MQRKEKKTIRTIFITGLLVLIPIVATAFILMFLFNLLDGWLAPAGGQILRTLGVKLPPDLQRIPGFGIVATVLLIFITGLFASNYLGRQILQFGDKLIKNIPLVNSIYTAMRQVVNSFSVTGSSAFQKVVMFEYPRKGIWSIGFLTTRSLKAVQEHIGQEMVNVFQPTTPNPTSGYLLMIPVKDVKILPITPEEGLKIIATVGLIQSNKSTIHKTFLSSSARKKGTVKKVKKSGKKMVKSRSKK